jgi:hypothetical protein
MSSGSFKRRSSSSSWSANCGEPINSCPSLPAPNSRSDIVQLWKLFLAGKAFFCYRRRQETKQGALPDFYIGAHAAVGGYALLTHDVSRYRGCFPGVRLIAPP